MKKLLILALLLATNTYASPIEFGVSIDNEGEWKVTGYSDIQLTDNINFFAEIDTSYYWEAGFGYSLVLAEQVLLTPNIKVTEYGFAAGVFTASPLSSKVTFVADFNYYWNTENITGQYYRISLHDSVDAMGGIYWQAHEYLGVMYGYNHVWDTQGGKLSAAGMHRQLDKGNYGYHEFTLTTKAGTFRPYITYTYFDDGEDFFEIGLSFKF